MSEANSVQPAQPDGQLPRQKPDEVTIRISRLTLLGVLLLAVCVAVPAVAQPILFGWLGAVPIALAVWILRVRTRVSESGLEVRNMRGSRHISWNDIKGLTFPKHRSARAELRDGGAVTLPAVAITDIHKISPLSGGRIPDLSAAAHE
ncbi:PH domain-containing protein [Hoyosella sp. YIM 151337]|uniref:PH domain-containing protein n=1 Tax=Hoyosella sp. YIM 151337 TaxID=2992742 RepID=UPI002235A6AA|nr:PH domain-containing protein [Hoyosella sp. YIM 151337]MCW4354567.1 PH domain-containing protein [Hoyosella sp. YIM 151337]